MFSRILIANRGEIAVRIIRTARRMGIATVAVYSEADRDAAHVAIADEALAIGPASARQSYLDGDRIIAAARESGAEAIHPGYGFLSENADFAEACSAAGLVFIGPPAAAIRAMGGKSAAKTLMAAAGVPLVPGYHGDDQLPALLAAEAMNIGYPVLIKPSAGGGGKGMRIVAQAEDFATELAAAKREALAAFGDERMLIEKYLARPRHVEVQVFADNHGNCHSLFERDCSIQRRHQKVIEEAPAPGLPEPLRKKMSEAAISCARAIDYSGAGTVEFLLDAGGEFYFMEMNTRLQVEHPVTEFITGLDLVEWQFRVAAGERLPEDWADLKIRGHSIEARLYAEDPDHDFLPSIGRIGHLVLPEQNDHIRIDSGVRAGDAITVHYDPMIAKFIVWDADRPSAVRRLRAALRETAITGVTSNTGFLARLAGLVDFEDARLDTGFIVRNEPRLRPDIGSDGVTTTMAALGFMLANKANTQRRAMATADPHTPWAMTNGFRLNRPERQELQLIIAGKPMEVDVLYLQRGFEISIDGETISVEGSLAADGKLSATIAGRKHNGYFLPNGDAFDLVIDGTVHPVATTDLAGFETPEAAAGGLTAPMPGMIRAILTNTGNRVEAGEALVIMEAMKMEHTIRAPSAGLVVRLNCAEGAMVEAGTVLVDFEAEAG
ncbi:acetyl/propionyl/methylcrotonyl-CoA carboxylase subunit alpha [Rhizobium sp. S95]|uniref:Acetyl/propionyl/methylcrotonyl-CoA carboxylase subunit alpha n=1 Tax=Ciceribacter sichuanensis TaxID=2949647 RepID=A0AAJ1C0F8_9HYPH|nr:MULTISPECIES: acetyl/propionyl/methylcrotonyl-CoA carboxylase subunit alpha [unclassified Ciceribacter]MCM2398036.1 acetyl/propionyl/methylcrotonyl-CoA carboxylase subunit alpha [Ciceribacter sp. S95]MCO5959387.1 acetyl/propionyl/methylcrotonyl-CoA carboxylase subunit alpha [Ciceribacter sp. S101]